MSMCGTEMLHVSMCVYRLIQPGAWVLDVGSNVGYFTMLFSQLVGNSGKVMGIEASPRTYDLVSSTVEFNGLSYRTSVLNNAVYDKDGEEVMISVNRERTLNNRVMTREELADGTETNTGKLNLTRLLVALFPTTVLCLFIQCLQVSSFSQSHQSC